MRLVLVLAVVVLLLVTIAGAASEGQDALLLVVDDHFILLDDRPDGPLPTVQPGENGHPADRGALTVLAAQAQDAKEVRVVPFSVSLRPAAAGAAARPAVPFGPPLVLLLCLTSWLHAAELIPGALLCFAVCACSCKCSTRTARSTAWSAAAGAYLLHLGRGWRGNLSSARLLPAQGYRILPLTLRPVRQASSSRGRAGRGEYAHCEWNF